MKRIYKNWKIIHLGKDKDGSHWLVESPSYFLTRAETNDPERRYREFLNSFTEAKNILMK